MEKVINGHPDYTITDAGSVVSFKYGKKRTLKQRVNRKGYLCVNLSEGGVLVTCAVHRLVAEAFVDNPQGFPMINHKDGDKNNNNASNLEWCTALHNTREAVRLGLLKNAKKFSQEEANDLKLKYLASNMSQVEFCRMFGLSKFTLNRILKNKY